MLSVYNKIDSQCCYSNCKLLYMCILKEDTCVTICRNTFVKQVMLFVNNINHYICELVYL